MTTCRTFISAAIIAIAFPAAITAQPDNDRLSLEMYLDWEDVQNPQISPDGSQIVYTRRFVNKIDDRWDSQLWIMNADGSRKRFLTEGSNATWSPDGTRIAFTRDGEPRGTQLFVRWMDDEGAVSQVTRVEKSPGNISWSPDGEYLLFRMLVPQRDRWRINMPSRPEGANWVKDPTIIETLHYRRERVGFLEEGNYHLFIVSADGSAPIQITHGDWDHNSPEWMPDGRAIVFNSHRVEDAEYLWRESHVYSIDVETREITRLTERRGMNQNPRPSPDGRLIAFTGYDWTTDTYVVPNIYVMNADGTNPSRITDNLDRRPLAFRWAADGRGVYINVDRDGSRHLYAASLNGDVRPVSSGTHMLTVTDINPNGVAVGIRTSHHAPNNVVSFSIRNPNQIAQLTDTNGEVLKRVKLGDVQEIWYDSVDDFRVQGWIVKPPDFDPNNRYPMMLVIHGGPHAMYNVGFNYSWQEHAANGYVVLYTNPRGSSGYGKEFGNAINNAYPGKDYDDLMNGVDEVLRHGYIDENNMFVYGCSGGGVLTAWIVGHTDRFAAASANCPVTNWFSFVGTTDGTSWYRNFEKFPWEDSSEHLRRSPLMYVGNVTTPTMLMTGERDLRTPIAQTEEFYQALKIQKVPTAMVRFPDEWHGTSRRPSNFIRTQLYLRKWFEQHGTRSELASH